MNKEERIAKKMMSGFLNGQIFTVTRDDVEIGFHIFEGWMQVGMGGEWWSGNVKMGNNILHHKKEKIDPAYEPVVVNIAPKGDKIRIGVLGGFGKNTVAYISIKG